MMVFFYGAAAPSPRGLEKRSGGAASPANGIRLLLYNREPVALGAFVVEKGHVHLEAVDVDDGGAGFVERQVERGVVERGGLRLAARVASGTGDVVDVAENS